VSDRSASILTKTQRRRLANDFEEVDGTKRRRDRQKIRDRVAAGLTDFEYLVDYPDEQLELALDDLDDEEIAAILADTHVLAERIRLLRDIDEDVIRCRAEHRIENDEQSNRSTLALRDEMALLDEAGRHEHDDSDSDYSDSGDLDSDHSGSGDSESDYSDSDDFDSGDFDSGDFDSGDFDSDDPVGESVAEASTWMRRGDALLKVSLLFLIPAVAIAFLAPERAEGPTGGVPAMLGFLTLLSGLTIVGIRAVKENVIPFVSALAADPLGTIRRTWDRI
jgi:hypothetical protein